MAGQPGVFDVVKAIRQRPFREWNVVYYDPAKTDLKKLEALLKAKGCPKAKLETTKPIQAGRTKIQIDNPVTVRGDFVCINIGSKKKYTVTVDAPDGWTVHGGRKQKTNKVDIQTPAKAKAGKYKINLKIGTAVFTFDVELVNKV